MYMYENHLYVSGSVHRPVGFKLDKGILRSRALDSLLASRLHSLSVLPELLLYSSSDGVRPGFSSLFGRVAVVNSLSDFWNNLIKEPRTSAIISQVVDELPGPADTARTALEMSLFKVKPFDLGYFEHLLEVQEQIYSEASYRGVLVDSLHRLVAVDAGSPDLSERHPVDKSMLLLEAYIEPESALTDRTRFMNKILLRGRDTHVDDFRTSLRGVKSLFLIWDQWLGEIGFHTGAYDLIYLYSQVKGLLPACWEELRSRGVAAEQIRLPQCAGHSTAVSTYLEFLLSDAKRVAFINIPMNGRCHIAEWGRLS